MQISYKLRFLNKTSKVLFFFYYTVPLNNLRFTKKNYLPDFFYSIDATFHINRLGRFVNDSINPNCCIRPIYVAQKLHLCIFALTDISIGQELRYTYGVGKLQWRKVCVHYYYFKMLLVMDYRA